ncbi:MAG: hypothetical protein PHR71_08910 [Polaromonas sp.]|nr:hypothetical protein [Polaromonas sp.]
MPNPAFSNIGKPLLATKIYAVHRVAQPVGDDRLARRGGNAVVQAPLT